jgi:hypothetical protein
MTIQSETDQPDADVKEGESVSSRYAVLMTHSGDQLRNELTWAVQK